MDIKQKAKLYDRLYRHADRLIRKHNPCEMKNGKCLEGKPCCNNCKYLTRDGCSIQCLKCKLFLCWRIRAKSPKLSNTFKRIQLQASRHKLAIRSRQTKEDTLEYLKTGRW